MCNAVKVKYEISKYGYFLVDGLLTLNKNDKVLIESDRGLQVGVISSKVNKYKKKDLPDSIYKVVRLMNSDDLKKYNELKVEASKAILKCREIVQILNLKMRILDAFFTFERNQLIFLFTSDERIDFRELARKLAQIYHTRIELRQIGVRDKAKEIGGLGPCGRFLCCSTFLTDFNSVSINMAKNQYIALNPTKINGVCGRLLCCLKYEDEQYTEMKKGIPKVGQIVKLGKITGKISSVNLLTKKILIEQPNKMFVEVSLEDLDGSIE